MKRKIKIFFRSFYITSVLLFCITFLAIGTAAAYQNMRLIGFGEHRSAIEIEDGSLKIFDFEIKFKDS